jgi:hypothetical protein
MSDLIRKSHPANPGEHVTHWLGAYLDGEVTEKLRVEIEEHLQGCLACQAELERLDQLLSLLHAEPPLVLHTSDSAFSRQVLDRINRPVLPLWQRIFQVGWRLAPLVIFTMWAFFQGISWMSSLVLFGMTWIPGMSNAFQVMAPLTKVGGDTLWSDLLQMSLVNPTVHQAADSVAWLEPSALLILFNLALIFVLAGLFVGWLASWWTYHRSKA